MDQTTSEGDVAITSVAADLAAPYLTSRRKRLADLAIGLAGISATIIVFPFVALMIKIDTRGPIFFRQKRVGINGRQFVMVKFRTMRGTEVMTNGTMWTSRNDPRITSVGKLLRLMYIDEFPQWWNVLKGEMSVIGPRPELPEGYARITQRYPGFTSRLAAKPGITGLAQTEYKYTIDVKDFRHKLTYDQKYIRHASLALDLWIIIRTIKRMILIRGS